MSDFIKAVVANANDEEFNRRGGRAKLADYYQSQMDLEKARPVPPSDKLLEMFSATVTLVRTTGSWNAVVESVAQTMAAIRFESADYIRSNSADIDKMLADGGYDQMIAYFESDLSKHQLVKELKAARFFLTSK